MNSSYIFCHLDEQHGACTAITSSGLDGKFPLREGPHLSELPGSFEALLVGRQSLAHGTRLLHAKVKGLVLLVPVQLPEVLLLLLVHDDVDAGDGLPHNTNLESLEAAPPVTLATRREANSVLRSSSCFVSSSFFLLRRSEHLTFTILMLFGDQSAGKAPC